MADFAIFLLTCVLVVALLSMLIYGAVWLVGRALYGPRKKPYQPAPSRRAPSRPGPRRPPSKPPVPVSLRRGRHARPRTVRMDPYPDVPAPYAPAVPPHPDVPPVRIPLCDADTTELAVTTQT